MEFYLFLFLMGYLKPNIKLARQMYVSKIFLIMSMLKYTNLQNLFCKQDDEFKERDFV